MAAGAFLLSLFGGGAEGLPLGPGGRALLYKTSVDTASRETERLSRDPMVKRDLARLDRAIAAAKTPADIFKDPVATRVLLEGLGLADQAANVGLAKQALLSDPAKSTSLAARLPDARWKAAAKQLNFAATGLATLRSASVREVIAKGVIEYRRVSAIEEKSRAVADALVIRKMADGATPNVYDLLGNKVLRRVVQTVAGLPDQLAVQSVEAQARQVESRVKLADFAYPAKREKLIQRYLMLAEDNQPRPTDFASLLLKL